MNPFFHRGPVRDPAYFFGRTREIEYAADLLREGQSLAVSGPRRIGKTSLLFHLGHPAVAAALGLGPDTTRWAYLDGGALDGLDEEWFYGSVDRTLGGDADAVPFARFVERLRDLQAHGLRLVLAIDEFELVAANPRFGPALFNRLRGLAAQFPLQFVTASKDPLLQLTFAHRDTLSSPFFNIFAPLRLGLLTDGEAADLLAVLSTRAGRPFGQPAVAHLMEFAGPHPLFLQVAGYRSLEARLADETASPQTVDDRILDDLCPHLQYYWANLDPEAQYSLATLPLAEADSSALTRLREAGLVRETAYLGAVLEGFVRRQKVEGLLQGGPFLMDQRRGLAAVGGRAVHLTPTEFTALQLFLEHPGQMLTAEQIEAALWPDEQSPDPERARGVVKKLRAALGPAGEAIVNRRGQGYLLAPSPFTPFPEAGGLASGEGARG